ncbi:endonuclease III [Geoalkalibacter halelectricus]|uniref:Endonuclease III n=1 Tax=Geoalkalibacter halelectricus TaxID=2847045 RepID=A0ABY5ZFU6_9BACT|nr:endonuclease III [Geoalkalibacter halelectricus]MDO3378204.1 endonuclease III [Geoalkalibacter halelectricus]UWZ78047.1 endonuclease III [Geoalkalibacter halelectricus]
MSTRPSRRRALEVLDRLEQAHQDAHCALHHADPWQLLVATILSAQCTDERVNQVTPSLFARYPQVAAFAAADLRELEEAVRPTGFFRNKARNIQAAARVLLAEFHGQVPETLEELVRLPGVGRKTANVVLGVAFGQPGMVVDTHVKRLAYRLGWTAEREPEKIEVELRRLLPAEKWTQCGHVLIFHGRRICKAPTPWCSSCPVVDLCPRRGVVKSR